MTDKTDNHSTVILDYTNYKGERKTYRVNPVKWYFGSFLPYHTENQWLMTAIDTKRDLERTFAMNNIHQWIGGVFPLTTKTD